LRVSLSPSTRRTFLGRAAVIGGAVAAGGLPLARTAALGGPMPRGGSWLPGDLHTHSTYSHDVYGGPTDTNTGPDEAYTLGLPVAGKFAEGRERGLAFMAVSDHNDVRSVPELSSASGSLVALPAYEHSIHGHAQMLGATKLYDAGDQAADAINAMANELRAAGGVFQANHPAYKFALDGEFHACGSGAGGCADCRAIHWQYGFDVQPDTIEVWNPSVARSDVSETYWECWLDRGAKVGGTGGSDSHWLSLHAIAGPGQPTTWVHARAVGNSDPGGAAPRADHYLRSAAGAQGRTARPDCSARRHHRRHRPAAHPASRECTWTRRAGRAPHPGRWTPGSGGGPRPRADADVQGTGRSRLGASDPSRAREATGVDDDRGRRRDADARRHAAAGDDLADLPAAPGAGTPRVAAQLLRQRLDQPRS
jgi:hypothetical protein